MKLARLYAEGHDKGVRVSITESTQERMRGLLGRDTLASDEALLLKSCGSVHTFGMQFPIDVLFLNRHQRIVAIHHAVPKRRMVWSFRASQTLEMPAHCAQRLGLAVGDRLAFEAHS